MVVGLIFVIFGAFFLLDEFDLVPYWFEFHKLWPLVFIIPGIMMITNANKKSWKEDLKERQQAERDAQEASQAQNVSNPDQTAIITDDNSNKEV